MTQPISRRAARRSALTLLYQWDVTERALGELYEGEIDEYTQTVTQAIVRDAAELDRRITEAAAESGWTADRLGAVERNILRIAVHELERAAGGQRGPRRHTGRLCGCKADHRADALASDRDRVAHGLCLAVQVRPELEPL